jgi:hypothetical protein
MHTGITIITIVIQHESKYNPSNLAMYFSMNRYPASSLSSCTAKLCNRQRIEFTVCKYTSPSNTVKVGLVGICSRIEGIKLTNESIIVAMAPIRLPNDGGNVNIDKLMKLNSQSGIKRVVRTLSGCLDNGI